LNKPRFLKEESISEKRRKERKKEEEEKVQFRSFLCDKFDAHLLYAPEIHLISVFKKLSFCLLSCQPAQSPY